MADKRTWTDDEIRAVKRVTPLIASQYLEQYPNAMSVALSMRAGRLPIGEAVQNPRTGTWTYRIDKDRLISYKHGVMPEADIQTLVRKLDEFTQMARKLIDTVREERAMMYQ